MYVVKCKGGVWYFSGHWRVSAGTGQFQPCLMWQDSQGVCVWKLCRVSLLSESSSLALTVMILCLKDIGGRDWKNYVWTRIWGRGKHVMEQQRRQRPQLPWKWSFWEQPAFTCFYSIFKVGITSGRVACYNNFDPVSLSDTRDQCRKNYPGITSSCDLNVLHISCTFLHL